MTKNVTVLDIHGNACGTTYPKRARGLVKKGRAHYVGQNMICLACPTSESEDQHMDYMNTQNLQTDTAAEPAEPAQKEARLDASYVVQKVDEIIANTEYLTTALKTLENLDKDTAAAATSMIASREATNQRMIDMLEKLIGKIAV